jgi:hypothetical protein
MKCFEPVVDHVSNEMVLYNTLQNNLAQHLMTLSAQEPAVLNLVVAIAATHCHNRMLALKGLPEVYEHGERELVHTPAILPEGSVDAIGDSATHTRLTKDALLAKERALCHFRQQLTSRAFANAESFLATVLLFIELDLIEIGVNSWKSHVGGGRDFVKQLVNAGILGSEHLSSISWTVLNNLILYVSFARMGDCTADLSASDLMPLARRSRRSCLTLRCLVRSEAPTRYVETARATIVPLFRPSFCIWFNAAHNS